MLSIKSKRIGWYIIAVTIVLFSIIVLARNYRDFFWVNARIKHLNLLIEEIKGDNSSPKAILQLSEETKCLLILNSICITMSTLAMVICCYKMCKQTNCSGYFKT